MTEESVFEDWREKLGIEVGMTQEEASECFMEWRATQKTCERCDGTKYVSFCPVHLICEEAEKAGVRETIGGSEPSPFCLASIPFKTTSIGIIPTYKRR